MAGEKLPPGGWQEWDSFMLLWCISSVTVLTLVEFTQAARGAERVGHPRLPASPALHLTLCGPDLQCRWGRFGKTDFPFAMLQHANKRRPTYTRTTVLSSMQAHLVISALDCTSYPTCPALLKLKQFECVESKTWPHLQFSSVCFSQCSVGWKEGGRGRSEAERNLDSAASNQLYKITTLYIFFSLVS